MKINKETQVGLLAAVAVTLLILGYNFLKGNKIFQKNFELISYYENVDQLNIGNPVIFNGLKVGTVLGLEYQNDDGQIKVTYSATRELNIPVDSKAIIFSSDLLGSKAIKIEKGKAKSYCQTGQILTGEVAKTLGERVEEEILPLKDKVSDLILELERFVGWLNLTMNETNGNKVDNIIQNLNMTSQNLASTSYKVDTILGSFQQTVWKTNQILENFRAQNDNITRIVNNVGTFSDSLVASSDDVRRALNQASSTIADIEVLVEGIENGQGTLGKLVTDTTLYSNLNTTMGSLDSLVNEFKKDPRVDIYLRLGTKTNRKEEEKALEERIRMREQKKAEKKAKKQNGQQGKATDPEDSDN